MSTIHSEIYGDVDSTCGRHNYTAALNMSFTFSMIPRTFHFGKYHINTSLPKLQPVSDTVWWKKSSFDQLTSTIYGILESHSVAYPIYLIACKVLIETFNTQQEGIKIMYKVGRCVLNINNLQVVAFLNASGKTVNVKSDKINDISSGLTFFRFSCDIESVNTDPYIFQKNPTFGSSSTFPNTSTISPPGSWRPSYLPRYTPNRPRGVRVVWLPSSEAHQLLELASVLKFLMIRQMWKISTRRPVMTIGKNDGSSAVTSTPPCVIKSKVAITTPIMSILFNQSADIKVGYFGKI